MHEITTGLASVRQVCSGTAVLLFILAAAGCERSPNTNGGAKATAQSNVTVARPAANAPPPASAAMPAVPANPSAQATHQATTSPTADAPGKFIAYYFHRTLRCPTCLSIEKQSQEAIELTYNGELAAGALEWQAVNIEEPGNERFEKDFALDRQALVLVELKGEEVRRHKKLERVWELVDDPYGFQQYVVAEVALFLGGG